MKDKFRGSLLGLTVGDAVGTTLEFEEPGSFDPITDMVGDGPYNLKPGEWTDDTSMALCLAESLIECKCFDAKDQLKRYVRWWKEGHLSSTDHCFDIGTHTAKALKHFIHTEKTKRKLNEREGGDGTIMRLAPVPLFYVRNPKKAMKMAAESSYTTHGSKEAADACAYLAGLIVGAISGQSKETLLLSCYCPADRYWEENPSERKIREIMEGSFLQKEPPEIVGGFYVVESLEAALWAFAKSTSFKEGCLLAVNLGNDADTTGAVYGQLAGAFYGESGIPKEWLEKLAKDELIWLYAGQLFSLATLGWRMDKRTTIPPEMIQVKIIAHGPPLYDSEDKCVGYSTNRVRDTTKNIDLLVVHNYKEIGFAVSMERTEHLGMDSLVFDGYVNEIPDDVEKTEDGYLLSGVKAHGWINGTYPHTLKLRNIDS